MRESNQKERLSKLKQGEGTFVYKGGAFDTEATPGVPALGKDGSQLRSVVTMTVEDDQGNKVQVIDPKSSEKGALVWKKAPQFKRTEMNPFRMRLPGVYAEHVNEESFKDVAGKTKTVKVPSLEAPKDAEGKVKTLWLEFPKGKPVFVGDPRLALKCRCLSFFREVEGEPKAKSDKHKGEKPAA